MKARKPNTDQRAEFKIYGDGRPLPEYILPSRASTTPNIVECFVPVDAGQELTIKGTFNGSILNAAFDVLADGAFVWDSRVEGVNNNFMLKFQKDKRIEMMSAFDNPKVTGWFSIEEPGLIVEGGLHVKQLLESDTVILRNSEEAVPTSATPGVGCVAVVVSLNQDPKAKSHVHQYWKMRVGAWRDREPATVRDSGIPPEFETEVVAMEQKVTIKRSSKHKRHWNETRFGESPWAKFLFYYRSEKTIKEAGCIRLSRDQVQDLDACEPGAFKVAQITAGPAGRGSTDGRRVGDTVEFPAAIAVEEGHQARPRLGGTLKLTRRTPQVAKPAECATNVVAGAGSTSFMAMMRNFRTDVGIRNGSSKAHEDLLIGSGSSDRNSAKTRQRIEPKLTTTGGQVLPDRRRRRHSGSYQTVAEARSHAQPEATSAQSRAPVAFMHESQEKSRRTAKQLCGHVSGATSDHEMSTGSATYVGRHSLGALHETSTSYDNAQPSNNVSLLSSRTEALTPFGDHFVSGSHQDATDSLDIHMSSEADDGAIKQEPGTEDALMSLEPSNRWSPVASVPSKRASSMATSERSESPAKKARLLTEERITELRKSLAQKKARNRALEEQKRREEEDARVALLELERLERENAEEDAKTEALQRDSVRLGVEDEED